MPNWCANTISISGPTDQIKSLFNAIESNDFKLLQTIRPLTDDDFPTTAWGTKWDVNDSELEYLEWGDGGSAEISGIFNTAWSPPIDAMLYLTENHPDFSIRLSYFEPGLCFIGEFNAADGCGENTLFDYSDATKDTIDDYVPCELSEEWGLYEMFEMMDEEE